MRIKKYLKEAKVKFKVKSEKDSFYNDPKMAGHRWSAEKVDMLETLFNKIVKTNRQKLLMNLLIDFENTDWHYFNGISKKEVQIYSYIFRRIDKDDPYILLQWHDQKAGMLKSPLTHILEYLSYIGKNKEAYFEKYSRVLGFYGMDVEDAKKRFNEYHMKLEKFNYIKELKRKWK